jgi:hypothetical protein
MTRLKTLILLTIAATAACGQGRNDATSANGKPTKLGDAIRQAKHASKGERPAQTGQVAVLDLVVSVAAAAAPAPGASAAQAARPQVTARVSLSQVVPTGPVPVQIVVPLTRDGRSLGVQTLIAEDRRAATARWSVARPDRVQRQPFAGGAGPLDGRQGQGHVAAAAEVGPFERRVARPDRAVDLGRGNAGDIGFEAGRGDALAGELGAGRGSGEVEVEGPAIVAVAGEDEEIGVGVEGGAEQPVARGGIAVPGVEVER